MAHQYYVTVTGTTQNTFKAESKKEGRKDKWMECIAFKMGSNVPYDANTGEAKGRRQHKPLTITKEWGAASPQFLQAHWTNEVLTEVIIEVIGRTADGKQERVLERITLSDAVVVSVDRYTGGEHAKEATEHTTDHLEDLGLR